MTEQRFGKNDKTPEDAETKPPEGEHPYSDSLLVDLLHLDWEHFFTRYRTDLLGCAIILAVVLSLIGLVYFLAQIGA